MVYLPSAEWTGRCRSVVYVQRHLTLLGEHPKESPLICLSRAIASSTRSVLDDVRAVKTMPGVNLRRHKAFERG